jgi:arabinose-5-phosphate isomerase
MSLSEQVRPDQISTIQEIAKNVMRSEARAINDFVETSGDSMSRAIDLICTSKSPLIVSGIGKSGHIARKIASTFCSLGKPAVFLHAAEASHGDLGIIQEDSVVLVLSNSGETSELSDILHYCRQHEISLIGLTGPETSTLAKVSDVALTYGKVPEACVNGLAPTTSTTLSLAIGDALAVGTSALMKMAPEDFRRYHPGGKLGSRLLSAADVMKTGSAIPKVTPTSPMGDVVIVMSEKSLGTAVVMDDDRAVGVITDGDMRRQAKSLWKSTAAQIATSTPVRVSPDILISSALELMNGQGITACLVEDASGRLLGILHIHDCLSKGGN